MHEKYTCSSVFTRVGIYVSPDNNVGFSTLFNFVQLFYRKYDEKVCEAKREKRTTYVYYLKPELPVIILELSCHTQLFSK